MTITFKQINVTQAEVVAEDFVFGILENPTGVSYKLLRRLMWILNQNKDEQSNTDQTG